MSHVFNKVTLLVVVCSGHAAIQAMEAKSFNVVVLNSYGAQIEVNYNVGPKHFKMVVNPNEKLPLGSSDKLQGSLTINRVGASVGWLTKSYVMQIPGLEQAWMQKQKPGTDTLQVVVESTALQQFDVTYVPVAQSALEAESKIKKLAPGDVLDEFPGLKKYGLEKTLTPERILAIKAWNEEVVPAGLLARATTGEDIARYILGLPIGYTRADVEHAYDALAAKWHPLRQPQHLPGLVDFAKQVMPLIIQAKNILIKKLNAEGHRP